MECAKSRCTLYYRDCLCSEKNQIESNRATVYFTIASIVFKDITLESVHQKEIMMHIYIYIYIPYKILVTELI